MRLQQFLARSGIASRRKAEDLIRAGRVSINNEVATIGAVVGSSDVVRLDGERVRLPQKNVVIALNKPKGYTTTHEDEHAERLVYDLVPEHPGLHSVGRLDKDTEGLLLLTTDGGLTQLLTHPRNQVRKLYRAWSKRGKVSEEDCRKLTEGVMLGDGLAQALEALPAKDGIKLVLTEGRKREVRRMLGKVGHPVERLVRLAVGPIELGDLEAGAWRYLSAEEVRLLQSNTPPPALRTPAQAQRQRQAASTSRPAPRRPGRSEAPEAPAPARKPRPEQGRPAARKPKAELETRPSRPPRPETRQTRPARPEAGQPRPTNPETRQPRSARPEAGQPKHARPGAGQSRPARPEAAQAGRTRPAATQTRRARPETAQDKRARPETGQDKRARPAAPASRDARAHTSAPAAKATKPRGGAGRPAKPEANVRGKKSAVESSGERVSARKGQGTNQRGPDRRANPRAGRTDKK